jgi:hypothetical protein
VYAHKLKKSGKSVRNRRDMKELKCQEARHKVKKTTFSALRNHLEYGCSAEP